MIPSKSRFVLALVTLGLLTFVSIARVGPIPPVVPFLDPMRGVWAVSRTAVLPDEATGTVPGLSAPARVFYDLRGVPHVFAANERDAYRAFGYVVARDRLFQLELQTRAAQGTLTGLVGPAALGIDRETRALGLPRAVEHQMASLDTTSDAWRDVEAYADGINAYIDGMRAADLPLEYRLLRARPARWKPVNTLYLLARMGLTLAYDNEEVRRLRAASLVGDRAAEALLSPRAAIQEPIVPNGQAAPRIDTAALPPPGAPDTAARSLAFALGTVTRGLAAAAGRAGGDVTLGSNNWAVSPGRTFDKYALLAGDPHLDLTLPSIWYTAHLSAPNALDVYGVSLPGAPPIIIGFNRSVAWTFTNTGADVMDFYAESVDVARRPTKYLLDGRWRPLVQRVERYRGTDGRVLATDTVLYTHRGPMRRAGGRWLSMRWTVLDKPMVLAPFMQIARARTADEWLADMSGYAWPAQNMLVADKTGTIAIRSTGAYPVRPGDGRGDVVRDGTRSASDWTGEWPLAKYPAARNPAQGFLASANQQPVDPRMDSTYLGADWPDPWRAIRINELLRADSLATVADMRNDQTDPGSARADLFAPAFLAAAHAVLAASPNDSTLEEAAGLLGEWDRRYMADNERSVLFEMAMRELTKRLWDELIPSGDSLPAVRPPESVIASLLSQPASVWWDDRRTPGVVEHRDDILAASLRAALGDAERRYGPPNGGGWSWSRVQHANIYHLLELPSLSRLDIPVQGGPGTLSPSSGRGTAGPSWRMVVELGPDVHGWGTLPGGESGNPASARYDNQLRNWRTGTLDALYFPLDSLVLSQPPRSPALTLLPPGTHR
ncbi:MAG TPA: penicillin acylase family protein [Gemmatimonadaceae bacterium]|nr:penicillin acylase family protein [Gemmatimonadaceae bacterium]